jgi:cytoskeletal protein RodZ
MNDWSDIGEKLKECREAQDLSLEDVAHKTRIPVPSLKAIEANYYDIFPSPAYTKSFVQQYAEYLDFDADEWLDNFQTGNVLANSEGIEYLDEPDKKTAKVPAAPKRQSATQSIPSESLVQPLLILLITGGLIAAGFWGFLVIEKRLNSEKPPPPLKPESGTSLVPEAGDTPRPPIDFSPDSDLNQPEPEPEPPSIIPPEEPPPPPPPRAIIVEDDEEVPTPLTPNPITGD